MEKIINFALFGNFKSIIWEEETNKKLVEALIDLNMSIGKTMGYEIKISDSNLQTVIPVEKPFFSNEKEGISLNITGPKIDFTVRIEVEVEVDDEILRKYYNYLEKIINVLNLNIDRIGISYIEKRETSNTFEKYKLPLYETKEMKLTTEFGSKQNLIKEIEIENKKKISINICTILEKNTGVSMFLVDINTIASQGEKIILSDVAREKIFNTALQRIKLFVEKIKNL